MPTRRSLTLAAATVALGLMSAVPAHAVANGMPAAAGAYPFNVKLTMTDIPRLDGTKYNSACSGALIAPQWLITAGHCFHDVSRVPVSGKTPYATTATVGRTEANGPGGHDIAVVEVRQAGVNDIALAKLATAVTDIAPLRISRSAPTLGQRLVLAGWGATTSTNPTPSTHLNLGVVTVSQLASATASVVGAAPEPDTSACAYDSGAPYFVADRYAGETLVSVESDGPDCPHSTPETTARVDVVAHWIDEQTR